MTFGAINGGMDFAGKREAIGVCLLGKGLQALAGTT